MSLMNYLSRRDRGAPRRTARTTYRPTIDALEDRVVLSTSMVGAPLQAAAQVRPPATVTPFNILPLTITSITNQGGQLLANVALGSNTTQVPVTLSLAPSSTQAVPVLDLHLNAIHLDLLGLKVDTSDICLAVTAVPGSGNLLGNLLADVANLLNSGTSMSDILNGQGGANALTPTELTSLTGGLTNLLNGALGQLTSSSSVSSATAARGRGRRAPESTSVLDLSLGPVNLNLLGLNVKLDDCNNGPARVAITAEPGPGRLLGNLISGVANLLNRSGRNQAPQLARKLHGVANQIQQLI